MTNLAMFRWTKRSPGARLVTAVSGARESEQPIHRICYKTVNTRLHDDLYAFSSLTLGFCPSAALVKISLVYGLWTRPLAHALLQE